MREPRSELGICRDRAKRHRRAITPGSSRICDLTKQREVEEKLAVLIWLPRYSSRREFHLRSRLHARHNSSSLKRLKDPIHRFEGLPPKSSASVQFNDQAPVDRRVVRS